MSITFTEREAIRKMLDYIEEERERLFNQSLNLLDRLRELDEIEIPEEETKAETKKPDLTYIAKKCAPVEVVEIVEDTDIPMVYPPGMTSFEDMIQKHNEQFGTPEEETPKYDTQKEILKDIDNKNRPVKNPTRNSKYRDVKVVAQYIKAILKEAGVPIRTAELISRLRDTGIEVSSPYVLLQQAAQYEPRIERAKFGYYQYKW